MYNKYQMVKAVVCFVLTSIKAVDGYRLLSVLYKVSELRLSDG